MTATRVSTSADDPTDETRYASDPHKKKGRPYANRERTAGFDDHYASSGSQTAHRASDRRSPSTRTVTPGPSDTDLNDKQRGQTTM